MNKSDLAKEVASASKLSQANAENVLNSLFEAITKALKKKEEVRLVGFGTFATVKRKATTGRNPKTGAALKIPAKVLPKFRPGKQLKEAVAKK